MNSQDKRKALMINFYKTSSPRSLSKEQSLLTHKNFGTPISDKASFDAHMSKSNSSNKKLPSQILLNLLNKSPTKRKKEDKWYKRIFRINKSSIKKIKPLVKSLKNTNHAPLSNIVKFPLGQSSNDDNNKKPKNFLIIVALVKKFIQIIKTYTFVKKIFKLKNFHFNLIGDMSNFYTRGSEFGNVFFGNLTTRNSDNYDFEAENLRMKKFLKVLKSDKGYFEDWKLQIKSFMKKIPILMPDNNLKLFWDFCLLFLILGNTLIIPLNLCFELENLVFFQSFDIALLYLITFDMILSLFTAYYSKGVVIVNRHKILMNFLSNGFLWDFLSVIPYFFTQVFGNDYVQLLLMLRLVKMSKIFIGLEEHLFLSDKVKGIYELFKLFILIIYVGHFFACVWIYAAKVEMNYGLGNSWIQNFHLTDEGWESQYITSLYFAVYTMVTVGYGDISPTNIIERALCIVLMILSCGVFAYSLNRFGTILQQMYQHETEFKSTIHDFTHYMKIRKVDDNLQMRIKRYMEYMNDENTSGFHRGELLLNYLSPRLKKELVENIYSKWIINIPILKNNFSEMFLKQLALKFEEKTYSPEDIIYEKGEIDNLGLYYIVKGEVSSFLETKDKQIQNIKIGESFGEYSFFSDKSREISVKSEQVTHVAFISRNDFMVLLSNFEEDFEKFSSMKEMIDVYGNKKVLEKVCISCHRMDHFINECPFINICLNSSNVISKYKVGSLQQRKKMVRRKKKPNNSRFFLKLFQEKSKSFEGLGHDNSSNEELLDELDNIEEESFDDIELENIEQKRDNTKKLSQIHQKSPGKLEKFSLSPRLVGIQGIQDKQKKDFDFLAENILIEEGKALNSEKNVLKRGMSQKKTAKICRNSKCSFESFNFLSRNLQELEKVERLEKYSSTEKNPDTINHAASTFHMKFADKKTVMKIKTKNLIPSIEEITLEKNSSIRKIDEKKKTIIEEKSDNSLKNKTQNIYYYNVKNMDSIGNSISNITDYEFDKLKIFKYYFIHNNIDHIIAINNSFITKRRGMNMRRPRKILVKEACKRKIISVNNTN